MDGLHAASTLDRPHAVRKGDLCSSHLRRTSDKLDEIAGPGKDHESQGPNHTEKNRDRLEEIRSSADTAWV